MDQSERYYSQHEKIHDSRFASMGDGGRASDSDDEEEENFWADRED